MILTLINIQLEVLQQLFDSNNNKNRYVIYLLVLTKRLSVYKLYYIDGIKYF